MKRQLEPELMQEVEQAEAYANADFSESDSGFVDRFEELFGSEFRGSIADLGCGPGNITFPVASRYPHCKVIGVDGSAEMLSIAKSRQSRLLPENNNIAFIHSALHKGHQMGQKFDAIVSNSLLHHLHDPDVLWEFVKRNSNASASILIRDLRRPETRESADELVEMYAATAPVVLRQDFYNSLLAAFEIDEVERQLALADLECLKVKSVGDRYLEVQGLLSNK